MERPSSCGVLLLLLSDVISGFSFLDSPKFGVHVIAPGETLNTIAKEHFLNADAVTEANPNLDPLELSPGDEIQVPISSKLISLVPKKIETLPPVTAISAGTKHSLFLAGDLRLCGDMKLRRSVQMALCMHVVQTKVVS